MSFQRTRIDNPSNQSSPAERIDTAGDARRWARAMNRLGRTSSKLSRIGMLKQFGIRFIKVVKREGPRVAIEKGVRKLRKKVVISRLTWLLKRGCAYYTPGPRSDPYEVWRGFNGSNRRRSQRLAQVRRESHFSILVPVYNPPLHVFRAMIESVLAQSYDRWELVLVDDASPDPRVRPELEEWARRDSRIKVTFRSKNGNISAATNQAADEASGDYFILLDNDDLLHPDALAHLAAHVEENPGTDLIYSDDDKIGEDGRHHSEQFKPAWSPELLLAFCYTGHITAVSANLYRAVGGMRIGFEGSQDHDFWLRASEQAAKIGHVPQILYHWRVLPGSTAASGDSKPASFEAGRRAVEEAFHRRGIPCSVKQTEWAARSACSIFEPIMPDDGPRVAILIPTRNQAKRLKLLIDSLTSTTYKNYRVYVIDNMSDDPAALKYLASLPHRVLKIPNPGATFNFAAINNSAVRQVDEELILFLNDDTEVLNPRWLSQMVGWSRLSGVGAVGARLLYPDRRVQHAGIVHGMHAGLAGHAFKLLPFWNPGYFNLARVSRNCLAVTAACMLTPRRLFLDLGGFDEGQFGVAYNDADYGYRLVDAGYRSVYCAEAELIHHEGISRGFEDNPREVANYRRMHGQRVDPYFSPHLDANDESFQTKPTVVPVVRAGSSIRVLGVTHNLNWEGAPRFEAELFTRMNASGAIQPTILSPCEGPLRQIYEGAGIEIQIDSRLAGLASTPPDTYRAFVAGMARSFKETGFELIHANTWQGFWAIHAAHIAEIPSVWSIHESEPWQNYFDEIHPEIGAQALACMSYPYRVVFTAKSTAKVCEALDTNHNFDLIYYALDSSRFESELAVTSRKAARASLQLPEGEVCVLILGTVCERKGQKDLLRAYSSLPGEIAKRVTCVVVGARDTLAYSRELQRDASKLPRDRKDRFRIVPETGDTARYWLAADIFCCSSRIESYPHVVQEAMAAGLPLVTTPVFGIAEQVLPSVNALVYEPGDYRKLAAHLAEMASNDRRRNAFAEASPWVLKRLPDPAEMDRRYLATFRAAAESTVQISRSAETSGQAFPARSRSKSLISKASGGKKAHA